MTNQSFRPYKVSAAYGAQVALQPQWTACGEWRVVDSFGDPAREAALVKATVGLQDVSALGKLDLQGTHLGDLLAEAQTMETVVAILRVKPRRALVVTEPDAEARVQGVLSALQARSPGCAHVTPVTSGLSAFRLVGPLASEVLSGLTALDLRPERFGPLACASCELARVHATIYRDDWGDLASYLLLVARDVGEYVWTTVRTAGSRQGLTPFGMAAERLLRPVKPVIQSPVSTVS